MTRNILKSWLMVLAICLVGCLTTGGRVDARESEKIVKVTSEQNGTTINLRMGDTLEVTLPSSLGTGFSWHVQNCSEILHLQGEPAVQKPKTNNDVGAFEYQIFRFEAKEKGTGTLKLQYLRPWEKGVAPAKEYSLTLRVE